MNNNIYHQVLERVEPIYWDIKPNKQTNEIMKDAKYKVARLNIRTNNEIVDYAIFLVCAEFEITREELYSQRRNLKLVKARQIAHWLVRRHTTMSVASIGRIFEKHHATILHSVSLITNLINNQFDEYGNIAKKLNQKF